MVFNRVNTFYQRKTRRPTKRTTRRQVRVDAVLPPSSKHYVVSKRGSNWAWEIAALCLSISTVSILVTLLVCVDGTPLDQWNFFISLNALISILAAVSRASLGFTISSCLAQAKWNWFRKRSDSLIGFDRFDDASRGPWGSLWLIIWLRTPHWVAIGAVATIMLVGFEPLLQVVISFSGQFQVKLGSPQASINLCSLLDVGIYTMNITAPPVTLPLTPLNETVSLQPFSYQPDVGLSSAVNSGFYIISSTDSLPSPTFLCSTSNCTWKTAPTIAICSACRNVTGQLSRRDHDEDLGQSITYALPFINITNWADSLGTDDGSVQMTATRFTDSQHTIKFKKLSTMITAIQVLKAAEEYGAAHSSLQWGRTLVTATECALYFCVNVLESTVENGILRERVVSSWHQRDMDSYIPQQTKDENGFNSYEAWNNHSLYSSHGDFVRDNLLFDIDDDERQRYNLAYRPGLTQNSVGSILHLINDEIFSENMVWPHGNLPIIQTLHEKHNMTEIFGNIARLVSNWMRDFHGTSRAGSEREWAIHIQVEWFYVVLPALTISLGYMFSVWIILETRQLKLQPWKTDMVETLAHSADVETGRLLMHANRKGNLRKVAKNTRVGLENTNRGLELRIKKN